MCCLKDLFSCDNILLIIIIIILLSYNNYGCPGR